MAFRFKMRVPRIVLSLLTILLWVSAARGQSSPTSGAEFDTGLTRYNGLNTSPVDISKICRTFSRAESLSGRGTQTGASWFKSAGPAQPKVSGNNIDLQNLLEHLPVAGQTIQVVTTTADSHPQVVRIVRFLTKHVDPQF